MLKRVFLSIALIAVVAYLATAVTLLNAKVENATCKNIELLLRDTIYSGFVDKKEISTILKKANIDPIGKQKEQISRKQMEEELNKHALIDQAECYWTPSGKLYVEVSQRFPILRIMSSNNQDYYIDNKGAVMPSQTKCVAHRTIVSGSVEKSFAMNDLYNFGVFLQNNDFWGAQIEQIHVLPGGDIELVPRIGNHTIFLGKLDNYEAKLSKLKSFYQKGLKEVGWDKYKQINIEFDNQIVCTKRGE